MPITAANPFKMAPFPWSGDPSVRPLVFLVYEHVSELLAERGVEVDPSCIWRWVQTYGPNLNRRCRPHLKATNKS